MPAVKEPSPAASPRKAPSRPPPPRQVLTPGQDRAGQDRTGQGRAGQDRTRQDRAGQPGRSRPASPAPLPAPPLPPQRPRRRGKRWSPPGVPPRRSAHPSIGCERGGVVICIAAPRPWRAVSHGRRGAADGWRGRLWGRAPCPFLFLFLLLLIFLLLLRPSGAALGSHHSPAGGKVRPAGAGKRG